MIFYRLKVVQDSKIAARAGWTFKKHSPSPRSLKIDCLLSAKSTPHFYKSVMPESYWVVELQSHDRECTPRLVSIRKKINESQLQPVSNKRIVKFVGTSQITTFISISISLDLIKIQNWL
jgi:hypothetical protein